MTPERLQLLLNKYLGNTASADEEAELMHWYNASNQHPVEWPISHQGEPEEIKARMLRNLRNDIHFTPRVMPVYRRRSWQIAASLLILLGAGAWFLLNKPSSNKTEPIVTAEAPATPILPGGNKATLTLADGTTIILDTAGNTTLAQQGTIKIIKLNNGELAYKDASKQNASASGLYNTIRTPNGGQYQVTLPDGTRAWLNAASVLRFPIAFSGDERKVQLSGEAYFDVAKNSSTPFRVVTINEQNNELGTVEVLGTAFNVNAYSNEPSVKTTLVEGKVKVSTPDSSTRPVLLTIGMQSSFSQDQQRGRNITVREVDTDDVIAWKNGLFNFNNADIKTVMRQLARWYDVEVVYEGALPNEKFEGEIPRNSTLSDVFKILELSAVHFKVEGRKVTVMP